MGFAFLEMVDAIGWPLLVPGEGVYVYAVLLGIGPWCLEVQAWEGVKSQ